MNGKEIRLSKLFSANGKSVIVAIDHGQTFGPTAGLEQFRTAAETLKEADGVLLAPHMVRYSGRLFQGKGSPTVITRLNWNTIHCEPWHYQEANIVKVISAKSALEAGAEVVLAGLVLKTRDEKHDAENVAVFAKSVEEANDLGLPIIGEVFPVGGLREKPDEFHDYIKKMCRIICELGADAIKTFYTGERFSEVTEAVPIPVFALGAEKMSREVQALELAEKASRAGARGVVFGRNVFQAKSPSQFLRALKEVVQEGASPQATAEKYKLDR
jgi:DhnA family fructose-bisphosphate aldolase class Ia